MTLLAPAIAIVNVDTDVSDGEILKVAAALTRQCLEHYAPAWGSIATVRLGPPKPGEWRLELRKVPTLKDALGYHDQQSDGTPILYVFPDLCHQFGTSWSSCASHEILEALADPYLRRCVQADDGTIWCSEIADAVEADSYTIDGVEVSNFCLPAWFEPPKGPAKYDYLGRCLKPYEIRPGGYGQTWEAGKGWIQRGEMRPVRRTLRELGLSRGIRRAAKGIAA